MSIITLKLSFADNADTWEFLRFLAYLQYCDDVGHSAGITVNADGDGSFIVMAQLPTGQVSNHYEDRFWELFNVPEAEKAPEWDGHTPNDAADRLESFLKMREPDSDRSNLPSDDAAMRKALEEIDKNTDLLDIAEDLAPNLHPSHSFVACQIRKIVRAALSMPARNCDVGTPEEQILRFENYCAEQFSDSYDVCEKCPLHEKNAVC